MKNTTSWISISFLVVWRTYKILNKRKWDFFLATICLSFLFWYGEQGTTFHLSFLVFSFVPPPSYWVKVTFRILNVTAWELKKQPHTHTSTHNLPKNKTKSYFERSFKTPHATMSVRIFYGPKWVSIWFKVISIPQISLKNDSYE